MQQFVEKKALTGRQCCHFVKTRPQNRSVPGGSAIDRDRAFADDRRKDGLPRRVRQTPTLAKLLRREPTTLREVLASTRA
ncbi:hypothetical protein MXD81_44405 [Microbacteriaceae bacterium K1510]|nr:hypothetical protein [Microbacteriaceae bacterium K1510]